MKKVLILTLVATLGMSALALAGGGGGDKLHWGYAGETGPEHWGSLAPEFKMCGEGKKQSPINITGAVKGDLPELIFDYDDSDLQLVNNGHTIKAAYSSGSSINVGGDRYQLLQFHFHSKSENAIEGELFPMEAHLVHANAAGELAVVGVMFKEGEANPLLERLWRYTPSKANSTMSAPGSIEVADLLPKSPAYYAFTGSLTTPPCTEGVRWMVLKQPVTVSKEQIAKFRRFFDDHDTNRPVQALNGRTVYK